METEFLLKFLISIPGLTDPAKIRSRDDLVRAAREAGRAAVDAQLRDFKEIGAKGAPQNLGGQALSHIMLTGIDEKWEDNLYHLGHRQGAAPQRAPGPK